MKNFDHACNIKADFESALATAWSDVHIDDAMINTASKSEVVSYSNNTNIMVTSAWKEIKSLIAEKNSFPSKRILAKFQNKIEDTFVRTVYPGLNAATWGTVIAFVRYWNQYRNWAAADFTLKIFDKVSKLGKFLKVKLKLVLLLSFMRLVAGGL